MVIDVKFLMAKELHTRVVDEVETMAGWLNQIFCLVVIGGLIQFLLGQRFCLLHICKIQNTWVQKIPFHYICTLFALISQIIPFPSHVLEAFYYVQNCIIVLVVSYCCSKIWISFICCQRNKLAHYVSSKS